MGYVFTYNDASAWERRMENPGLRAQIQMENRVMCRMLHPLKGQTVLDIGCGTGEGLAALSEAGLQVTGLDPSEPMLALASGKMGNRADLHRGAAEDLPFDDNAFTYVCLSNTLEFADDPLKAMEEAFRVAKDKVFIGILNRHSLRASRLRTVRLFTRNIWSNANLFTVWQMKRMTRTLVGNVPFSWRSANLVPIPFGRFFRKSGYAELISKNPISPFIGMTVIPVPRFRTRPLELKRSPRPAAGTVAGLARSKRSEENGSISV
ncbi:MAG: class I SAM-dependent methyltransferase [Desulfobacterales bacterium]